MNNNNKGLKVIRLNFDFDNLNHNHSELYGKNGGEDTDIIISRYNNKKYENMNDDNLNTENIITNFKSKINNLINSYDTMYGGNNENDKINDYLYDSIVNGGKKVNNDNSSSDSSESSESSDSSSSDSLSSQNDNSINENSKKSESESSSDNLDSVSSSDNSETETVKNKSVKKDVNKVANKNSKDSDTEISNCVCKKKKKSQKGGYNSDSLKSYNIKF